MRILVVTPYIPSPIRVRPYQIVRELGTRHDVTVLAVASGREPVDGPSLATLRARVDVMPLRDRQTYLNCLTSPFRGEPLQASYCRSPELLARFQHHLTSGQYDAIHIEHLRAAHLLDVAAQRKGVVYDAVDSISLLLARTLRGSHSWKQRLVALVELAQTRAYERRILERTQTVCVTSEDDAQALRMLRPRRSGRISVIPNGVDLDYFRPQPDAIEPSTIVISGKMSYHANVTAVLYFVREVFPKVKRLRPDARLRIVGSDPPPAIRALEQDPSITVTGYLPDVRPAIASATVAVCPVTVKVGIQNKILEAMALGVPVVSTALGVMGLETQAGRDLLVGEDAECLAEHVLAVLEDVSLRRRLAESGRSYVESNHRWSTVADTFERLYDHA